jgi:acetolactate synthase-1/2/3 large subunit
VRSRLFACGASTKQGILLMMLSGAKCLMEALQHQKVSTIFGLPGGQIMPVYDALLDSGIRHILVRHEQSAVHMADGYARASGRTGVCMATSGPGATNLVTGIANAYMDSSPVVAFTGQVPRQQIGTDAFQEADIIGITTPITKYSFQIRHVKEIPRTVKAAFHVASTGRPGPVLVDIPKDVQMHTDEVEFSEPVRLIGYRLNGDPKQADVQKAVELLSNAERPFILAGGGVRISNAYEELRLLAELLSAPVGTSLMGKGCFPEDHPLSLGIVGMHGRTEANKLILEADTIFAVGMRFSDRTTCKVDEFCPNAKIIHADIDATEIEKNKQVDVSIVGDATKVISALRSKLVHRFHKDKTSEWHTRVQQLKEIIRSHNNHDEKGLTPTTVLKKMRKILPADAIVTTEVGQNQMWAALHFSALSPRTFITSGGLGTMGFGFPAAIGAKVARPEVPVVDIAGDGSFIMTENSLATSVSEQIPVIVIVLNNRMLGMVAQWQRCFFNRRYSAVKLGNVPDFVKLAQAYGAEGIRVQSIEELSSATEKALRSSVTTVIDVPISPEEDVFPMVPPGNGLEQILGA